MSEWVLDGEHDFIVNVEPPVAQYYQFDYADQSPHPAKIGQEVTIRVYLSPISEEQGDVKVVLSDAEGDIAETVILVTAGSHAEFKVLAKQPDGRSMQWQLWARWYRNVA